ncbi:phospholipid/cholesterol/gamma-HCH transport system ATP-binding protein [Maridesulfovibrio ferrireducens]|uniref:Phospholipid/cholesterol/gamma-HCH transport system ATP-binding protein n=1 Tax=Maridesulfovibrio ferrireducens TaxID=246191 RepID=A0A1G9BKE4_9BACT|nr:ATP-binding cassette domain-containing protein [Maridesulfovibrio ferrireducens]SDK39624.1 phospholipid/cholesterol/gamma-HCH transport system ATP-binding protein [Maridesulfovibrio ferrireducens]
MKNSAPDIRIENLTIGYDGTPVVNNINATLPGGGVTVILGGSGCGKSTLLKNILRLNTPLGGAVFLGKHNILTLKRKAFRCLKQRIGVLFQDGALLGSLNLFDNVALPLREHTRLKSSEVSKVVKAKLNLVGLEPFVDYFPNELSGGMRKRAGLARAMVMDPDILFCDEPTSGLDPINSAELDELLLELKESFDMTIVVVSHDLASMKTIADHVLVLGEGTALFEGSKESLLATENPYLRQFLDRQGQKREAPRLTMPPLDPSVMKMDCTRYLGDQDNK